jgi:hypothetical protein
MRVLAALHRFAESGEGDVKAVSGREELRLRVGDYRLFFVSAARLTPSRFVACFIAAMLVGERRAARKKKNLTQRAQRTRRGTEKMEKVRPRISCAAVIAPRFPFAI